jgi:L-ribulokinase
VDRSGAPLSLLPEFAFDPDAMFVLWKDHTGITEAAEINDLAHSGGVPDYTKYCGGVYSSEWFWSKILHIMRTNRRVAKAAYSWVEHCDWLPALLIGNTDPPGIKRSRCAAGHKALWHASWGGLPPDAFLRRLDKRLAGLRERLYMDTFTSDIPAGTLCAEWAQRLGLDTRVVVSVGAFDAHMGAVGGQIGPGILSKVMGTSTCDMLVAPLPRGKEKLIRGICGQVDGSIIPDMLGLEAGQSAFGDIYAWFRNLLLWPVSQFASERQADEWSRTLLDRLAREAENTAPDRGRAIALDWMNGRRTPFANQELAGAIAGINLGSDAPAVYRALVEATAFGAKKIVDCFTSQGVDIKGVIALGGIAKKSPFVMQVVADVLDMPIRIARSDQACALGAAMFAAVAAKIHRTVEVAQKAMGNGFEKTYTPNPRNAKIYKPTYRKYCDFGMMIEKAGL